MSGLVSKQFTVRVPASTSNLGAGFDCFGLALRLYVTVRAEVLRDGPACVVESAGAREGLPHDESNLIYRAMRLVAEREGWALPPLRLRVENEIPLSGGLGSSAAAIVAGVKLAGAVCGRALADGAALCYATEMEGHPDNAAASLHGGFVVNCTDESGAVVSLKQDWPDELKIIAVSPHAELPTKHARAVLPAGYSRAEAIFNMQRAALFVAALQARDFAALWEATRDAWHQRYRAPLVPGLAEALALPRLQGLRGLFLSGAGPTVLALADNHFAALGEAVAACFTRHNLTSTVRLLAVDAKGAEFLCQ
jgi:homoserine kinase